MSSEEITPFYGGQTQPFGSLADPYHSANLVPSKYSHHPTPLVSFLLRQARDKVPYFLFFSILN